MQPGKYSKVGWLLTTYTAVVAGVLGRAHTVAAMDETKVPQPPGSSLQSGSSAGIVTALDLSDSTAWKKQRPGATFFEKLQVSLAVATVIQLATCCASAAQLHIAEG